MKILMLGWELPPYNSGGLGVACYHLSKALSLEGSSIDFVLPYTAEHPNTEFMNVHGALKAGPSSIKNLGIYDSDKWSHKPSSMSLGFFRDVQQHYTRYVEELSKSLKPDIIHAHDWLTMEAGVRAKTATGAPLVVHVHATEYDRSGEHYGNALVHEIEQQALTMADRIIAVSSLTKNILVHKYEIPQEKIDVLHNGIDVDILSNYSYDFSDYRYFESLKSEGYTIVTVLTRFTVQKGLTHFLKAAARASEIHNKLIFLLAGDGEQRNELIRMSADLGIADKVYFTGFVRGKQWSDVYSLADVFVISSVSEPFGLTGLEAAHHGNALIISRQSGVGEVLKNVFRFNYWDTDMLADQIVGIALSRGLGDSLRENVKEEYSDLSWDKIAKKCLEIFNKTNNKVVVV